MTRVWIVATALTSGVVLLQISPARAEPDSIIVCIESGPAALACAAAGVLTNEVMQAINGKEAFGPNGELMRILAAPVKIVDGNIKGSERESGNLAKALRAIFGVSARDIGKYGIWGGPNSFFRRPFN